MVDAAFLSLARRLGNPIAERSDALEALALLNLTRACRASSRLERLLQSTIFRFPKFRSSEAPGLRSSEGSEVLRSWGSEA